MLGQERIVTTLNSGNCSMCRWNEIANSVSKLSSGLIYSCDGDQDAALMTGDASEL